MCIFVMGTSVPNEFVNFMTAGAGIVFFKTKWDSLAHTCIANIYYCFKNPYDSIALNYQIECSHNKHGGLYPNFEIHSPWVRGPDSKGRLLMDHVVKVH